MTSEIRTNSLTSRAGLSTVTLTDSGPMFSGITTFVDNSTFSVGTGGTIHAPATNTLNIGVNNTESIRIDSNSNVKIAGVCTATHFYGDGSNLSGISAGTALSGSTNNTVCTVTGANAIQGEANLTYDGTTLKIGGDSGVSGTWGLEVYNTDTSNNLGKAVFAGNQGAEIKLQDTVSGEIVRIAANGQASFYSEKAGDPMVFYTKPSGGSNTERLRIESGGSVGISSAIQHIGDIDTNFGFPSNDSYRLRLAGSTRLYTSSTEPIWHRRDVSAGVSTQTMLLNYNNAAGSGVALAFAPSTNYDSRHSSIEVVNDDGNNNMSMRFKVTDASQNAHALERMRIQSNGIVKVESNDSSGLSAHFLVNNSESNSGLSIMGSGSSFSSGGWAAVTDAGIIRSSANSSNGLVMQAASGDMRFYVGGNPPAERVRITSAGTLNIGGSTQTTHLLYLQSTGDAGIHIRADSDNSGENDNPYVSFSQDGSNNQELKIGQNGDSGQNFSESFTNSPFIHANHSAAYPLQLAHMDNLVVNIAARKNEIALNDYAGSTIAGMEIHHRGNDTGAALKFSGHNNTGTPGVKTFTQLTHRGGDAQFEIHHMGSRAMNIGSTRRIRLPGIVGVAGSGLQTVYVESDGNLCTTSSLREYKTNITAISDTSWLYNLNPVTFNWKKKTEVDGENVWEDTADSSGTQYGLIAEEVETVKKDFCSYDNNDKLTGVHYDRMIAPLIKAVQDLKSEINNLEQDNIALRARVTNLEGN